MDAPLRIALGAALVIAAAAQCTVAVRSLLSAYYAARGMGAQAAADHEGARRDLNRANRAWPFDADRLRLEAAATRESIGPEAAAPLYDQALRRAPHSPLLLLTAAENLMALDRSNDAEALFERGAALLPDDWRAHHLRGLVCMKRQHYADAANEFRAALAVASPFQPEVSHQLARALHATGAQTAALDAADRAIAARELSPDFHLTRGQIRFSLGRLQEAKNDFSWAVESFQRRAARGKVSPERVLEAQALLTKTQAALDILPR